MFNLIILENDESKVVEYNKFIDKLSYEDTEYNWSLFKISNINDVFQDYDMWIKELRTKNNIKIVEDTVLNTKGFYISGLNTEGMIDQLTNYKLSNSGCCYGVCDNASQIFDRYKNEIEDGKCIIIMTPIFKENQSVFGGWRWHKWGKYIGIQNHKNEYLADEEDIDMIYVYEIKELEDK